MKPKAMLGVVGLLLAAGCGPKGGLSSAAQEALERVDEFRGLWTEFRVLEERLQKAHARMIELRRDGLIEDQKRLLEEAEPLVARYETLEGEVESRKTALREDLDARIAAAPADGGLREARSRYRDLMGDLDGALSDLEEALRARPQEESLEARRADLLRRSARHEEARAAAERILRRRADHPAALAAEALSLYAMNEFAAAVPRLEKAEKLKGSLPPALEAEIEETLESAKAAAGPWEEELERRAREREADDLPRVRLKTDKGDIVVELFENEAPNAVANFVDLCSKDFYAGTTFHRIEFGRRVIGGDPLSKDKNPDNDGTGGPGYTFRDEFEGAYRRHFGGSLAMWSHGRDSNGSQFFIDVKPLPELDGKQVVFGRVIEGMAVVARLRAGDKIVGAEILRKRAHAYRPVIE